MISKALVKNQLLQSLSGDHLIVLEMFSRFFNTNTEKKNLFMSFFSDLFFSDSTFTDADKASREIFIAPARLSGYRAKTTPRLLF